MRICRKSRVPDSSRPFWSLPISSPRRWNRSPRPMPRSSFSTSTRPSSIWTRGRNTTPGTSISSNSRPTSQRSHQFCRVSRKWASSSGALITQLSCYSGLTQDLKNVLLPDVEKLQKMIQLDASRQKMLKDYLVAELLAFKFYADDQQERMEV